MARSVEKLKKVQTDIQKLYPKVQTKVVVVDFSDEDPSLYKKTIEPAFAGLDIGILVNNVGISYEHPMFFGELPQDRIDALVRLNIYTMTQMTKTVLPILEKRKRGGAIINVSSVAGILPSPLLAVYSASKSYIDFFSRSLSTEYKSKGIFVQSITPSLVVSKLSKVRKPSLTIPSAKAFVRAAVSTIGYDTETSGYWAHNLQTWVLTNLPSRFTSSYLMNMHLSVRKRAQSKKSL